METLNVSILQIGLSIVGYSKTGLIPIISTKLPFLDPTPSLDTFLYRFSTPIGMILGQGDQYYTGLYGPYPVPNYPGYRAYSYSFYLMDTILGTPRDDLNAFLIALVFVPKDFSIDMQFFENYMDKYVKSLTNLNDLLSKNDFEIFFASLKDTLLETIDKEKKVAEPVPVGRVQTKDKPEQPIEVSGQKENPVFIELKTEPESIIAVPWILHAVYHGLEQATFDILGENSSLLEMLMEQYTAEILDRFHLFDSIFANNTPSVKDALELGAKHLARVGEMVTVKALAENKFELSIQCSFANAVHPYLPITKCLWMRYLSAMVRRTLPPNKELHMSTSQFDSEFGSNTIVEIVPKVFKTI